MFQRTCLRRIAKPSTRSKIRPRDFNGASHASSHYTRLRLVEPSPSADGLLRPRQPAQSSFGSTILLTTSLVLALSSGVFVYQLFSSQSGESAPPNYIILDTGGADEGAMVGTIQPGRPGNLTTEQEVKLQEFWKATMKVFGVPVPEISGLSDSLNGALEGDEAEDAADDGKDPEKKKKKGLFRRKRKETKENKDETAHSGDAEDKYGQTKEFHQAIATNSPEELRTAFWSMVKHDHPDGLLLRFLRARKWDIEKALVMMVSTMHWRLKEMHVDDDIVINGEESAAKDSTSSDAAVKKEGGDFMHQLRLGKSFLHGTDKEGRPMCTVRVRLHRQGEQTEKSLERFTVHVIETCRLMLAGPVDTATIVFDMTGFSMANMDYTPVKFMIKVFEANYPESLGVVLVHKAPWVFQGIWKIIKGWLDPVVAGKVHFTNNVDDLANYIERPHIVKELGGKEDWDYQYIEPADGENAAMTDTATRDRLQEERKGVVKEFEEATIDWFRGQPGDKATLDKRNTIAEKLRSGYWALDPYIRAKSLYDRTGVINKGGRIQWYKEDVVKEATETPLPAADTNADDVD